MSSKIELCEKAIRLGLNNSFPCNEIEFCDDCPFDNCCDKFISERMLDIANEVIRKNKCKHCNDEKEIMYTADCNSIYISNNKQGKKCIINSDTYKGNEVEINYCPFCGKKLV